VRMLVIVHGAGKADLYDLLVECFPYEVTQLQFGEEVISRAAAEHADIIILDTFSPDEKDIVLCEMIRSGISAPILITSVVKNPELIARALNAGADDVLIKPISRSLLTARINGLLSRSRGEKIVFRHASASSEPR
jgi:DNA-binding response OmpR family regulator